MAERGTTSPLPRCRQQAFVRFLITDPPVVALLSVIAAAVATPARADTHYVTIVNGASAVMDTIRFTPAGGQAGGDNRLRSSLPPNVEARIAISSTCAIDIRVTYVGGGTDEHDNVNACTDPRVTFLAPGASPDSAPVTPAASGAGGEAPTSITERTLAPRPVPVQIPPAKRWDGHSLSKRLGLDGWVDP